MRSFERLHYRGPFATFIFQGQIVRREAHHQIRQLLLDKGDACTQAIGPIRDDQIPCLQLKDLQLFAYLSVRHLQLGEPTRNPDQTPYPPPNPSPAHLTSTNDY